jgi:hypothetical protein
LREGGWGWLDRGQSFSYSTQQYCEDWKVFITSKAVM